MALPVVPPFHAIAVSRLAHQLEASGQSVIHMQFGQPSSGAPQAALAAARAALDGTAPMGYWMSEALRARLSRHYADTYGLDVPARRILLVAGASAGLTLAFSYLFEQGSRVALTRPGYGPYRNGLTALRLVPQEIDSGPEAGYQLTAAALATLDPPPAGVILASPANPTGTMVTPAELAAIAGVCRERGIRLISDEIYHGLSYGPQAVCALSLDPDAIIVNSFSKYYCLPGWRLGWLVVPDDLADGMDAASGNLFLTPPALSQHAALAAMDARDELDANLITYRANRERLMAGLHAAGISRIAPPDGAFYIYADVGHLTQDSMAFCLTLLRDTGVAIAPGIDFDPDGGQRTIRFSFAVSEAECAEAIARFSRWLADRPL
jgi:aspartate/methionine/tyrosine aminotransferase